MTQILVRPCPLRASEMLRQQGIHPLMARLFAARGIADKSALSTELSALLPPDKLLHANEAAALLADIIAAGKKITVIADYDCDGATACAIAVRGLRMMGARVDYLVPNRFETGYGLTPEIVVLAQEKQQPDALLTVDNGIASLEGVAEARRRGMTVIITDHHLPGETLPDADIIVNPSLPDCNFPSRYLAGVSVMFYVLLALRIEMRTRGRFDLQSQPRLDQLLDLVALGTIADVVRLDTNNRILVAQGLQRMRAGRMQAGLAALFQVAGRDFKRSSTFDLGFALAPRLNAAGRLSDMALGIECLLTENTEEALKMAMELNAINQERRDIEAQMQADVQDRLDTIDPRERATISLLVEEGHQGVVGILASRIKENFYRPVVTFAPFQDSDRIVGSGRSVEGFHLRDALDLISRRHPDLIIRFGGHAMAAGVTILARDFERFAEAFETVGREWLDYATLQNVIETDGALENADMTPAIADMIQAQVWGQGFPAPVFSDIFQVQSQRILKDRHMRLWVEKNGSAYDAIWFGHTQPLPEKVRLAYRLETNTWQGKTDIQLIILHAEAT